MNEESMFSEGLVQKKQKNKPKQTNKKPLNNKKPRVPISSMKGKLRQFFLRPTQLDSISLIVLA